MCLPFYLDHVRMMTGQYAIAGRLSGQAFIASRAAVNGTILGEPVRRFPAMRLDESTRSSSHPLKHAFMS